MGAFVFISFPFLNTVVCRMHSDYIICLWLSKINVTNMTMVKQSKLYFSIVHTPGLHVSLQRTGFLVIVILLRKLMFINIPHITYLPMRKRTNSGLVRIHSNPTILSMPCFITVRFYVSTLVMAVASDIMFSGCSSGRTDGCTAGVPSSIWLSP